MRCVCKEEETDGGKKRTSYVSHFLVKQGIHVQYVRTYLKTKEQNGTEQEGESAKRVMLPSKKQTEAQQT